MSKLVDDIYIEKLAEKLWGSPHSKASVMIGAGFSRNASINSPDKFPLWGGLKKIFLEELHKFNKKESLSEDPLTIASEYEAAFGRNELNNIIKNSIPDHIEPSSLHELLLKLPWKDVFTTNYDTLLERGADRIADRKYYTINVLEDIANSYSPRIVKLHGSLPSYHPYIITSEDYRRYPSDYAPFVNLMQQSIMENILCLIGFSGQDPNFVNWIGWVRDNLGQHQPPIYLCGVLGLTESQRRLFEERNIYSIDLSRIVETQVYANEDQKHYDAIEYLLARLLINKPVEKTEWPNYRELQYSNKKNSLLDDIGTVRTNPLAKYNTNTPNHGGFNEIEDWVQYVKLIRSEYPGWILTPHTNLLNDHKSRLLYEQFEFVFSKLQGLGPNKKLEVLSEVAWILRTDHIYLFDNYVEDAIKLVEANFPFNKVEADDFQIVMGTRESRENWIDCAIMILEVYRIKQDEDRFLKLFNIINRLQMDSNQEVEVLYQKGLFHSSRFEKEELLSLIDSWPKKDKDVRSEYYKAAIYLNIFEGDKAKPILRGILADVRKDHKYKESYFAYSLEGLCIYLMQNVDYSFMDEVSGRYTDLRAFLSDPFEELSNYSLDVINDLTRNKKERKIRKNFAPHSISRTVYYGDIRSYGEAHIRYLKVFDDAGLPLKIGYTNLINKNSLGLISKSLPESEIRWIFSVLVRHGDIDLIDQWLDRKRVNELLEEDFQYFLKVSFKAFKASKAALRTEAVVHNLRDNYEDHRLQVSSELLSRLIIRAKKEKFIEIFNEIIDFSNHPVHKEKHFYHKSLDGLLNNSIYPIRLYYDKEILKLILSSNLLKDEDCARFRYDRHSVFDYFRNLPFRELGKDLPVNLISRLISLSSSIDEHESLEAKERLFILYTNELLNDKQKQVFADLIWSKGIEGIPFHYKSYVLMCQAPLNLDAVQEVKKYLMSLRLNSVVTTTEVDGKKSRSKTQNNNSDIINEFLIGISNYRSDLHQIEILDVDEEIINKAFQIVFDYWQLEKEEIKRERNRDRREMFFGQVASGNILIAMRIISRIVVPNSNMRLIARVKKLYEEIEKVGLNLMSYKVSLVFHNSGDIDERNLYREHILRALNSSNSEKVSNSLFAILDWAKYCQFYSCIDSFPADLMSALALKSLYQKKPNVLETLTTINSIIEVNDSFLFGNQEATRILVNTLDNLYEITDSPSYHLRLNVDDSDIYDDSRLNTDYSLECNVLAKFLIGNNDLSSEQLHILSKWKERGMRSNLPEVKLVWKEA